ncbi:hypothetical protein ScPMuIL_017908 [Solemya velum]
MRWSSAPENTSSGVVHPTQLTSSPILCVVADGEMNGSGQPVDGQSPESYSKSISSKTSINVKLPSAQGEDGRRRGTTSGGRRVTPMTPGITLEPTLEGNELIQGQRFSSARREVEPIAASSRASLLAAKIQHHPSMTEMEAMRRTAATIIERSWIAFRDKQMFRLLKHAVCAAENSLSHEILRKVCPKEAEFFSDKSLRVRVRFRFGGSEFPPMIFFKNFIHCAGKGLKYLSGKRMIKPASEAAEDSLRLMGNRRFYDQLLRDTIFQQQYRITDEVDVTTMKDYMQYLANVDEAPAALGGKENYWRKLTLDVLPRHNIFYDIVDFLYNQQMTPRLQEEIPLLVKRPVTQDIQLQHIRAISQIRSPITPMVPAPTPKSKMSGYGSQLSHRRSKQARHRAAKLRKMYGLDREGSKLESRGHTAVSEDASEYLDQDGDREEEWEREASKLYEWTQELSFNDELMATPRLMTSA